MVHRIKPRALSPSCELAVPRAGGLSLRFLCVRLFLLFVLAGCPARPSPEAPVGPPPTPPAQPLSPTPPPSFLSPSRPDVAHWAALKAALPTSDRKESQRLCHVVAQEAAQAGHAMQWAAALIYEAQLAFASQQDTVALDLLRADTGPKQGLARLVLDFYYAQSLRRHLQRSFAHLPARPPPHAAPGETIDAFSVSPLVDELLAVVQKIWLQREAMLQVPAESLAAFFHPGTYPPHVRGTLRDLVTYFIVDLLADLPTWHNDHLADRDHDELHRLLSTKPQPAFALALDDSRLHPLLRALPVLDDLAFAHQDLGHLDAALEARIERLRQLHHAVPDPSFRRHVRSALLDLLQRNRQVPWSAVGMLQLALFFQDADDDGALASALAVAQDVVQLAPRTDAALRAAQIIQSLTAPHHRFSVAGQDGLARRSIQIRHRNLPKLLFRAYLLPQQPDLDKPVALLVDQAAPSLPTAALSQNEILPLLTASQPAAQWTVDLPATPDLRDHITYSTPPLTQHGLYVLVASASPDFSSPQGSLSAVPFLATDLVLVAKLREGTIEGTAVTGDRGRPLSGVRVALFVADGKSSPRRLATATTDARGMLHLRCPPALSCWLVASHHGSLAVTRPLSAPLLNEKSSPSAQVMIFTDRSVLRPNTPVQFKILAYQRGEPAGRLAPLAGHRLTLRLLDPTLQEAAKVSLQTSVFGTAAGQLLIPSGRPLGTWSLLAADGVHVPLHVAEDQPPTFEVRLHQPAEPLRLGQSVLVHGQATTLAGMPLLTGRVRYRVSRQPVYPPWWGHVFPASPPEDPDLTLASGDVSLDAEGAFHIAFEAKPDARLAPDQPLARSLTYRYHLVVDVTDEAGQTQSSDLILPIGAATLSAALTASAGFWTQDQPISFRAMRRDLAGQGRAGQGTYRLLLLQQPAQVLPLADQPLFRSPHLHLPSVQTPGDKLRVRIPTPPSADAMLAQFPDGHEVQRGILVHDTTGAADLQLPHLPPGAYRLRYQTQDDQRVVAETFADLLVVGSAAIPPAQLPLCLRAQQPEARVGSVLPLLVFSGFPQQVIHVEITHPDRPPELRTLIGSARLDLPIVATDRGGIVVSAWTVYDHFLYQARTHIAVPLDKPPLQISLHTFRDRLRPGTQETWRVQVRDAQGTPLPPGAAEILATMTDRRLEPLFPHSRSDLPAPSPIPVDPPAASSTPHEQAAAWMTPPPQPPPPLVLGFLPASLAPSVVEPGVPTDLAVAQAPVLSVQPPPHPPGLSGKRTHRLLAHPFAPLPLAPAPVPSDPQTAFFLPTLLTGSDGEALIDFRVPDVLTTWNVWLQAVTKDGQVGTIQRQVQSIQDLQVSPWVPRFLREGDRTDLRVLIRNASQDHLQGQLALQVVDPDTKQSLSALFQVPPLPLSFALGPGKEATLAIPIVAPSRPGLYSFLFTATTPSRSDAERHLLPVLPGRLHLSESRGAALHDKDRHLLIFPQLARSDDPTRKNDQLIVTVDAQLLQTVLKSLPSLLDAPYPSAEQILNQLFAAGLAASLSSTASVFFRPPPTGNRLARQESAEASEPARHLLLEETPWLADAPAESTSDLSPPPWLEPRAARAQRDAALARLLALQSPQGGYPWSVGGPPSPTMTLYVLAGLAKALEVGVEVPRASVRSAWRYLAERLHHDQPACPPDSTCSPAFLTRALYALSSYPDSSWFEDVIPTDQRRQLLDLAFARARQAPLSVRCMLALTLRRMGRLPDARLVLSSMLDAAKESPDQGVFFPPEPSAWLSDHDPVEAHALALRTLLELDPQNRRLDGLVTWLLLHKQQAHWKSTRTTAEVLSALVQYLKQQGTQLGRDEVQVQLGPERHVLPFEPDRIFGRTHIELPSQRLAESPTTFSIVAVEKETKGIVVASATWQYATDRLPVWAPGDLFFVSRQYFKRALRDGQTQLLPLTPETVIQLGDELEVQLTLRAQHPAEQVHLSDPHPSGFAPTLPAASARWNAHAGCMQEVHGSGTHFFFEHLPAGEIIVRYRLRASLVGTFRVAPATLQALYSPAFGAYSAAQTLVVRGATTR